MYVNTSFGCRTQGQECTVGWFSALSPSRNFSTGIFLNAVPIANSAEKFLLEAIPGVPFSGTIRLFWLQAPGQPESPRSDSTGK